VIYRVCFSLEDSAPVRFQCLNQRLRTGERISTEKFMSFSVGIRDLHSKLDRHVLQGFLLINSSISNCRFWGVFRYIVFSIHLSMIYVYMHSKIYLKWYKI
jgi:hypothetical protein